MIIPDFVIENNDVKKVVNMRLFVRYMVSYRCKETVRAELQKLDIHYSILPYGAIEFIDEVSHEKLDTFKRNLRKSGLDLLDVQESKLVERIIKMIIEVIHNFDKLPRFTYSEIITKNLGGSDESVFKLFSEVVGMSVVQFIVAQKVDRAKELLLYEDYSLSEIARILNYKNEQKLISQFKKFTGLHPVFFKNLKKERKNISSQSSQYSNSE